MSQAVATRGPDGTQGHPRPRVAIYDGLRGIAIILVVLSHGWTLWPTDRLYDEPIRRVLFTSGNFAVTIFFVVGFFLATRALLARAEATPPRPFSPWAASARRYIRVTGQVAACLVAMTVIAATDASDPYTQEETRTSILRILTHTWNVYLQDNAITARPDLGHLWYLSVDLQVFVIVATLVWLLRRHRRWLVVALAVTLVLCFVWRAHVHDSEGIYQALLRTTVRMDAPLAGALAAAAMPWASPLRPFAKRLATLSLLALVPLAWFANSNDGYFGPAGALVSASAAIFMVTTTLATPPALVGRALEFAPLAFLGRHSLTIFVWHYPLFWFVARHSVDWETWQRVLAAGGLTAVACIASTLLVERYVNSLLGRSWWSVLDRGVPAAAWRGLVGLPARVRRSRA